MSTQHEKEHVPVLLSETLEALAVKPGDIVVDATVGLAGHAKPLLEAAGRTGRLIGLDLDPSNLDAARAVLEPTGLRFDLVHANFASLPNVLRDLSLDGADAIVADLGVASTQIDRRERGFSYLRKGPLDMRMDPTRGRTAAEVLQTISPEALASGLRDLGDEEDAEAIAQAVVTARALRPIDTTGRLTAIVCKAKGLEVPARGWGRLHPAAKAFQAVRMLVNRELDNLGALLRVLPFLLRPAGRAAIVSFHSGEDRLVKASFREGLARGLFAKISPEAIRPAEAEQEENSRSWSARMRWAVRA